MIKFQRSQDNPKEVKILKDDVTVISLTQVPSTLTNKYFIIENVISDMSQIIGPEFDNWFENFLNIYSSLDPKESDFFEEDKEELLTLKTLDKVIDRKLTRYDFLLRNLDKLTFFVDDYISKKEYDFGKFSDISKMTKTSIFFDEKDIDAILRLSCYLKIYSIIFNTEKLKLEQTLHKRIYNKLVQKAIPENCEVISKILDVMRSKAYTYKLSDSYMWEYIKRVRCRDIDDHIYEIFNFIMINILILAEFDKNPITYFMVVTKESINWFLRSVYKGTVVYENTIATEDIHTTNINNMRVYSYNDTLGRLKELASNKVYDYIENIDGVYFDEKRDENLTKFQTRISAVKSASPIWEILTFPVLSYALDIPYKYVETMKANAEDSLIVSIYLHEILNNVFSGKYENFFKLLLYYVSQDKEQPKYTTYSLKDAGYYINEIERLKYKFYQFNTKIILFQILSNFVGKCTGVVQHNSITGEKIVGIPIAKIEREVINFYTKYFSDSLKPEFDYIKELILDDF